jgi:hypothetical protein
MPSLRRYRDNLRRTLLTLGLILLVSVLLGLSAEMSLRSDEIPSDSNSERVILPPLGATLSLALTSLRTVIPVIGALVITPLLASWLFQKIHAIRDLKEAHDTLNRIGFGTLGFRPYLLLSKGRVLLGEDTSLGRVGGPGGTVIHSDTAAVTEQFGRLKRVLGPGFPNLERFERVWETVDLRPQHWVYEVFALTKEGIPISCEADISFQIDDQSWEPGWQVYTESPYPYAEEAVFKAATSKWIREPDREDTHMAWTGRVVIGFTEGLLRNILAEYRLDWLIAPPQPNQIHPREEIRQRLEEGLGAKVGDVGAKLLKVKIGAIEVKARDEQVSNELSNMVSKQWIDAWHADWKSRALETRAQGEAALLQTDIARVQAQAEMVMTITEALQSTMVNQQTVRPYILALRLVEALRWMSYNPFSREFMPPEARQRLNQLQDLLESETGTPNRQAERDRSQEDA